MKARIIHAVGVESRGDSVCGSNGHADQKNPPRLSGPFALSPSNRRSPTITVRLSTEAGPHARCSFFDSLNHIPLTGGSTHAYHPRPRSNASTDLDFPDQLSRKMYAPHSTIRAPRLLGKAIAARTRARWHGSSRHVLSRLQPTSPVGIDERVHPETGFDRPRRQPGQSLKFMT